LNHEWTQIDTNLFGKMIKGKMISSSCSSSLRGEGVFLCASCASWWLILQNDLMQNNLFLVFFTLFFSD
jgi:hypothetical protein